MISFDLVGKWDGYNPYGSSASVDSIDTTKNGSVHRSKQKIPHGDGIVYKLACGLERSTFRTYCGGYTWGQGPCDIVIINIICQNLND